jgi:hypothetical protein
MPPTARPVTTRHFFSQHGPLSTWHPNFEFRPGQLEMALEVEDVASQYFGVSRGNYQLSDPRREIASLAPPKGLTLARNILLDSCFGGALVPPEYDIIGPWSEVKLAILREYAAPYSKIVSAKGFHHL